MDKGDANDRVYTGNQRSDYQNTIDHHQKRLSIIKKD